MDILESYQPEPNGPSLTTKFVETQQVKEGVSCDLYTFEEDSSCDLGRVTVKSNQKTPLQRILKGEKTVERHVSGNGTLQVGKPDSSFVTYQFPSNEGITDTEVHVGETMQWTASPDGDLVFDEICWPAYQDGRFENMEE